MRTDQTIGALVAAERRGPGTDAERRAAQALAGELRSSGRDVRLEPFWCRPNTALAHAWHAGLGLAGSLVSVGQPRVGGALVLAALVSAIADDRTGISLGRRLTPERASQNVVALPPEDGHARRITLIITANYDAGATGLVYRDRIRNATAALKRLTTPRAPGWLGWLVIALVWLLAVAILRLEGSRGTVIGAVQLIPTVALVLALALLVDLASASPGPAAGDNGSGVAAAIAIARALDAAAPRHAGIRLVLQGAGEGGQIGLRRYLRAHTSQLRPATAVVLGVAPCGAGMPRWWVSDGALLPQRYFGQLRQICERIAHEEPDLSAQPHFGRGGGPALPARLAGLPAITIGAVDERGVVPRSHQPTDTPDNVDSAVVDRTVEFGLLVIDEIDRFLGTRRRDEIATPA
jgi:hypothetical protein